MSSPTRATLGLQSGKVVGGQPGQRVGTLEVRRRIQAAELSGTTDPQAAAQRRGDKMSFREDDLPGQHYAGRGQGGVVTALAFQQNLVADSTGKLPRPRACRHHDFIGLHPLTLAEPYRYSFPIKAWPDTGLEDRHVNAFAGLARLALRGVTGPQQEQTVNQLLRDADWAGMAHGVEIRVPYVDPFFLAALPAGAALAAMDAKAAVARAADAFKAWRLVPAPKRGELVRLLGEELRAAKAEAGLEALRLAAATKAQPDTPADA